MQNSYTCYLVAYASDSDFGIESSEPSYGHARINRVYAARVPPAAAYACEL